jgi:integrase
MGRRARGQLPQMRRHRRSGTARVRIGEREIHLGRWGSEAAHCKYREVIQDFILQGEIAVTRSPRPATALNAVALADEPSAAADTVPLPLSPQEAVEFGEPVVTVAIICARYLAHLETEYVNLDGTPTSTRGNANMGLRALEPFWQIPAAEFGPILLRELRKGLIQQFSRRKGPENKRLPKPRKTINRTIGAVLRVFRWAVSMELVPPAVYEGLKSVEPLRIGRTPAPELPEITAVSDDQIERTLVHLPQIPADMVRVQRLIGCRPSELCGMCPIDIDRSGEVWVYRPPVHKNRWRGDKRRISIGPKAQAILSKYLDRPPTRPCFVPAESETKRNLIRRRDRRSPMTPSHQARLKKPKKKLDPNKPYTDDTYRRAIHRACEKAGITPAWSPNQLRHAAAEEARQFFGLDGAQARLGHKHAKVTEVYAKAQYSRADEVAKAVG